MLPRVPLYSEKPQGKEGKEWQKEWPDLEEGSEAELTNMAACLRYSKTAYTKSL